MYQIKLPVFEGPFDLLLYLIRKNEIDIYDIPIARITREYLEYIELMQLLDLEIAGEFIEMVATLILIKTRMLLPNPVPDNLEDPEDPRLKLTLQLLEYKRFRESAETLRDIETERRRYFSRAATARQVLSKNPPDEEEAFTIDATLFDLLAAFKTALDNMPRITIHQVTPVKVTVEDQVNFIFEQFSGKSYLSFMELAAGLSDKIHVIVTFMAILDLMRLKIMTARQSEVFGDIRLIPLAELSMSHYMSLREGEELSRPEDAAEIKT